MDAAQISIVLGILGLIIPLIVSVMITLLQRNRKEISYTVISEVPLLSVRDEFKDKVEILFDGKPVSNTHFIVLQIRNSGNVPILPGDYIEPVNFNFGEKAEILNTGITETSPNNIKDKISMQSQSNILLIKPSLLNKGYSITIKVIVTQLDKINAEALIAGIDQIKESRQNENSTYYSKVRIFYKLYPILLLSLISIANIYFFIRYPLYLNQLSNFVNAPSHLKSSLPTLIMLVLMDTLSTIILLLVTIININYDYSINKGKMKKLEI